MGDTNLLINPNIPNAYAVDPNGWLIPPAPHDSALAMIDKIRKNVIPLDPDELFRQAEQKYLELETPEKFKPPQLGWLPISEEQPATGLVFAENPERATSYRKKALDLLRNYMQTGDPNLYYTYGDEAPVGVLTINETNGKPYLLFNWREYLGVLEGTTDLAILANMSCHNDGHVQIVKISNYAHWHTASNYDVKGCIKPLLDLSAIKGNANRFVGFTSGIPTFAQYHMQGFPEIWEGHQLPFAVKLENKNFKDGYNEIEILPGIYLPVLIYNNPDKAVRKLNILAARGYVADMFMIQGKIVLFPVDPSKPNVIDPTLSVPTLNDKILLKELFHNLVDSPEKYFDDPSVLPYAVRPAMEKMGFLNKPIPNDELLQKLGLTKQDFIRNFWIQISNLFPKELRGKDPRVLWEI